MNVIRVALDVPLSTLFDYRAEHAAAADVGARVIVPFGSRRVVGVIVEIAQDSGLPAERLKPAQQILHDVPPLPGALMQLLQFCAEYYHHPLGEVILNALPGRLRQVRPFCPAGTVCYSLTPVGRAAELGMLPARAIVKRRVLQALREQGPLVRPQLDAISARARKAVTELVGLGWVEERIQPPAPTPAAAGQAAPAPRLNAAQQRAVQALTGQPPGFAAWLLHGITGSGKTEVYLHAIAEVLQKGGQALLLVPEINLTPQLESRLRARFPGTVLVSLHSGLSQTERLQNWLLAQAGQAGILLGTRLAVFTPMPRLALIVVDEEHDASFKQQDGLRYSARDVAVIRAKQAGIPVLLGSATPSLESYHNAQIGRYRLLELPERAADNAALPQVRCIDTRREELCDGLTGPLLQALRERLARREQSLVFLNRRGYAPVLVCGQCSWLPGCPRCSGRLVVHLREQRLRCHHCGHQVRIPAACPECGNADLTPLGEGTQRLESALARLFPAARILRVDRDSARQGRALPELLRQAHEEEVDILVGTQMLAKGHDFRRLTLVGVVNVDSALYSADFRAAEKLFALLMQVAGRAGRASGGGEVLIQTRFPDHPLFAALKHKDYAAFAAVLLEERRQAGFPPFCYQAVLRAEAPQLGQALAFLQQAAAVAPHLDYPVTVYDPVPAAMPRIAGKERAQLLVQADSRGLLHGFLGAWLKALPQAGKGKVRWGLDVDPLDF